MLDKNKSTPGWVILLAFPGAALICALAFLVSVYAWGIWQKEQGHTPKVLSTANIDLTTLKNQVSELQKTHDLLQENNSHLLASIQGLRGLTTARLAFLRPQQFDLQLNKIQGNLSTAAKLAYTQLDLLKVQTVKLKLANERIAQVEAQPKQG